MVTCGDYGVCGVPRVVGIHGPYYIIGSVHGGNDVLNGSNSGTSHVGGYALRGPEGLDG